jgi:hypothetical protein
MMRALRKHVGSHDAFVQMQSGGESTEAVVTGNDTKSSSSGATR